MFRFLHIADIHLGCRRYNLDERVTDFFRAWDDVIERYVLREKLDFVLICGDFFNARKVDPQTMNHAMIGLDKLRLAGIPVVAIEGNHDMHEAVSDFSWMRSLSQWGFIRLLEPQRDEETGQWGLAPWDDEARAGSYVDIAGARIFGTHWYGTSANAAMTLLADSLRGARDENLFNILMLHTDVEGQLNRPNIPALSVENLKELRSLVAYVALGHTHKRFEIDNWAFNPGSLEACSIDEYREERGLYLVTVSDDHQISAEHIRDYTQRPFQRLSFDVSGAETADEVHAGALEVVRREARTHDENSEAPAPIIEVSLKGHLGFKNSLLDLNKMRDEAKELTGALHVMMRNQSVPQEYAVAVGLDADTERHVRERRIVEDLIMRHNRYGERHREMATLVLEAKRRALSDESPEEILGYIEEVIQPGSRAQAQAAAVSNAQPPTGEPEAELAPTPNALHAIERSAKSAVTSDK